MKGRHLHTGNRTPGVGALIGAIIVALLVSCGGKKDVKPVSQENRSAQEAFSVVEVIRDAYVRKDFPAIQRVSTDDGYREIFNSLRHFDSVELTFTPRWVEMEKSSVSLNVAWKGSWTVGSAVTSERGMAVFLLEGRPLKVSKIVRGNPFKYPER